MRSARSNLAAARKSFATVALVLALAAWCAAASALADGIKVRIFAGTDQHWVPFQVVKQKGCFSDEGLDVDVTVFTTGATAVEVLFLRAVDPKLVATEP